MTDTDHRANPPIIFTAAKDWIAPTIIVVVAFLLSLAIMVLIAK